MYMKYKWMEDMTQDRQYRQLRQKERARQLRHQKRKLRNKILNQAREITRMPRTGKPVYTKKERNGPANADRSLLQHFMTMPAHLTQSYIFC